MNTSARTSMTRRRLLTFPVFAATRGELKSADVLKIAEWWEAWVTR